MLILLNLDIQSIAKNFTIFLKKEQKDFVVRIKIVYLCTRF